MTENTQQTIDIDQVAAAYQRRAARLTRTVAEIEDECVALAAKNRDLVALARKQAAEIEQLKAAPKAPAAKKSRAKEA